MLCCSMTAAAPSNDGLSLGRQKAHGSRRVPDAARQLGQSCKGPRGIWGRTAVVQFTPMYQVLPSMCTRMTADLPYHCRTGCNSFGEEFHDIPTTRLQLQHARRQRQLLGRLGPGCDTTVAAEPRSAVADLAAGSGSGEGEGPGNEEVEAEDLGRGHLGLWPSFSMLNHSCLPNAINYVVGDRMLVFAARHVPKVGHRDALSGVKNPHGVAVSLCCYSMIAQHRPACRSPRCW